MPNYFRQQSPWLDAAQGIERGAGQLSQIMMQVPQVRAQMQRHADEMGIRQGGLELQQQEHLAKVPVYNAQAMNYQAGAEKDNATVQQLMRGLEMSKLAQENEFIRRGGMPTQTQSPVDPMQQAMALVQSAFAGTTAMDPASSQRAYTAATTPVKYNLNQIGLDPNTGKQVGGGLVSVPHGNPVFAPSDGTNALTSLVLGQFRPSGAGQLDPSTIGKNTADYLTQKQNLGSKVLENPAVSNLLQQVEALMLNRGGGNTNQTQAATQRPVIKSIKQIR